jgi:ABC-2 type transport system permease protein
MPPVQAIIAKELRSYFVSPIVYVVGGVFLLTFGFLAYLYIVFTGAQAIQLMQMQGGTAQINLNDLVFRNLFASMRFVLLLILPILTMRLLAEERKLRTFEFLMTAPIRVSEIIVGKFISVYLVFLGMLLLTTLVPLTLALFSDFDWYPVLTGYLGLTLPVCFLHYRKPDRGRVHELRPPPDVLAARRTWLTPGRYASGTSGLLPFVHGTL